MIHCPNCNRLISKDNSFCPYCGISLQQSISPKRPKYYHHHAFRNVIIVVLILIIGAGGFDLYRNHISNTRSTVANKSQQNKNNHTNGNLRNGHIDIKRKPSRNRTIMSNKLHKRTSVRQVNRPGYTLSEFPNNIRGTWYTYDQGKLLTITVTSHNIVSNGANNPLHSRPIHIKHLSRHPNWMICLPPKKIHGINLIQTLGWNQTAGDGESFGLINYKGIPVLEEDGGAKAWVDNNFFKSKAQAQRNRKKTLPHEIKRPNM